MTIHRSARPAAPAHGLPVASGARTWLPWGPVTAATNSYGVLGALEIPLALGLLRLSTEGRPSEEDALGVIRFALDQGIRVLDTADSYALSDSDLHYGEHLVRKALADKHGPPAMEIKDPMELAWENATSTIRLVRGTMRPKKLSSLLLIHHELQALAESRVPKRESDL